DRQRPCGELLQGVAPLALWLISHGLLSASFAQTGTPSLTPYQTGKSISLPQRAQSRLVLCPPWIDTSTYATDPHLRHRGLLPAGAARKVISSSRRAAAIARSSSVNAPDGASNANFPPVTLSTIPRLPNSATKTAALNGSAAVAAFIGWVLGGFLFG